MVSVLLLAFAIPLAGQTTGPRPPTADEGARADTIRSPISTAFERGGAHRWLWGSDFRDAWGAAVDIPVLDLRTFGGGLAPANAIVGQETRSLVFRARDGRTYIFRGVLKDPTLGLHPFIATSPAGDVLRDQVSAEHPLGSLVTHELETAAGLSAVPPELFVMPDDPALGEFRETFGNAVGLLTEVPGGRATGAPPFGDFEEVVDGNGVFDRIMAGDGVVDARRLLAARLIDMLVGDRDRQRLQWRWGRRAGETRWVPIPEDHDQAFLRLDGFIPARAHIFVREYVGFGEKYPDIVGLHFVAREIDRRFLVALDRPTWDSVALATRERITDEVIAGAVSRLPAEHRALDGAFLETALRLRRDSLVVASTRLYELLADDVEVHLTDRPDEIRISRHPDGSLEVDGRTADGLPTFRRTFDPAETSEVRLHLWGGSDELVVVGPRASPIHLRVVGGEGDDRVRIEGSPGRIHLYDRGGMGVDATPEPRVDRDRYDTWVYTDEQPEKPIDWGRWVVPRGLAGISSDYGVFAGGGATWYRYGFRRDPYASRARVLGGISTQGKVLVEADYDFRKEASTQHVSVFAGLSELDVVNFFGFGNDTEKTEDATENRIERRSIDVWAAWGRRVVGPLEGTLGAGFEVSNASSDGNPFFADSVALYGRGEFLSSELFGTLSLDTRDFSDAATSGVRFDLRAGWRPAVLSVEEDYFSVAAGASTYLSARRLPLDPTLAMRAGATRVWGTPPFFHAALLGGDENVRGYATERFAGDASVFGTVELRLLIDQLRVAMLGDVGLLGFVDAGRVFVDGDSPGGWHVGYGGGLWLTVFGLDNTLSTVVGLSEEQVSFYFWFGMPF